jgi:predicted transcriptional regulator YdeE
MAKTKLQCDPICSTLSAMADRPDPVFRTIEEVPLIGTMSTYDSQAEASQGIPQQWRAFRQAHPALGSSSKFYGASPCTGDRKIHYLAGVAYEGPDRVVGGERLTLEAGEYAVIHVNDVALLGVTWTWLLGQWLATSGRREKNAPEFERFTNISQAGTHWTGRNLDSPRTAFKRLSPPLRPDRR